MSNSETHDRPYTEKRIEKMLLVCRDNDAYSKYLPLIKLQLEETGINVETLVCQRETRDEDVSEWVKQRVQQLQDLHSDGYCVFADRTVAREWNKLHLREPRIRDDLDEILDSATHIAVTGENRDGLYVNNYKGYSAEEWGQLDLLAKKIIATALAKHLETYDSLPNVNIVAHKLSDHLAAPEETGFDKINATRNCREADKWIAEKIKQWFTAAGFPEDCITLMDDSVEYYALDPQTIRNSWLLVDRHIWTEGFKPISKNRDDTGEIILQLPCTNLWEDLRSAELIESDDEIFPNALRSSLNQYINNYKEVLWW